MRGNIEIDKDRYPYTGQRIGETSKVVFTPSQEVVLDVALPLFVAERAAALVNAAYHDPKGKAFIDSEYIREATKAALAALLLEGELDGVRYSQLKDKLKELVA